MADFGKRVADTAGQEEGIAEAPAILDQRPSKLDLLIEQHRHYHETRRNVVRFASAAAWGKAVEEAHRAMLIALDAYIVELDEGAPA